jgi:hypothetical protein
VEQSNMPEPSGTASATKAGIAWAGVGLAKLGINTWSDMAAVAATIYTLCLIGDWAWKKWKARK